MSLITENQPSLQHITSPTKSRTPLVRTEKSGPLLRGLLAEWDLAATNRRALQRANSWGLPGGPVDCLDDIVVRAGFGRPVDCDEADTYLHALVARAAHDPLAARIVLQRLLPPVISIAKRRGKLHSGGIEGAIGDLVTQAWFVITSYPIERRPRKVAANMVRDIEYHEFVSANRPRRTRVDFIDHGNFTSGNLGSPHSGTTAAPDDDAIRNLLLELERRGVSDLRREIIKLSCAGWTCTDIGLQFGMPERTVRWHRTEALKSAESFVDELRLVSKRGAARRRGDAA